MQSFWDQFVEEYRGALVDWSLRFTLEVFWVYCEKGKPRADELIKERSDYQQQGD